VREHVEQDGLDAGDAIGEAPGESPAARRQAGGDLDDLPDLAGVDRPRQP
jgi:hypothetical protein